MATENIEFVLTARNATEAVFNQVKAGLGEIGAEMAKVVGVSAAIVAAVGAVALKFAKMADELDNNSTILDISAQTLREWQHVAVGANIDGQQFVGMLEKLSRSAGEAAGGNQQLLDSFKKVGITQEELRGSLSNLQQLFPAVIQGLRDMGTGYGQVASIQELLGRGAVGLTSVVRGSAEAAAVATQKFREQAGVLNDQEVKALADAHDAWELFLDTLQNRGLTIFASLVTGINAVSTSLANFRVGRLTEEFDQLQARAETGASASTLEKAKHAFLQLLVPGGDDGFAAGRQAVRDRMAAIQDEIAKIQAEQSAAKPPPPPPDRGAAGSGQITDPALALHVAEAQAAAQQLLDIGALTAVAEQVQTDFALSEAQREADERIRILQGWAIVDGQVRADAAEREKKANKDKALSQAAYYTSVLASQSTYNKTFFTIAKAAAIANAIISTYQGAAQALKDVPYPYNIAAAAAVVVAGIANVAQIASTSYGQTSAGGAGTAAGPGGFAPAIPPPAQQPAVNPADQQPGTTTIVLRGGDSAGRALLELLSVEVNQNDGVFIQPGSRQAAELA